MWKSVAVVGPFTAVFVEIEKGRVGAYIEELTHTYAEGD